MSRKCLYFSDDQVVFQCRQALWREDAILEDRDVEARLDMGNKHSISLRASAEQAHSDYVGSVYWYNRRNLSSNVGALNAFTGISQILLGRIAREIGQPVYSIYGLPYHLFDWAILW